MARGQQRDMQELKRKELKGFVRKIRIEDEFLQGCFDKWWNGGEFSTGEKEEFYHSRLRRESFEIKRREFLKGSYSGAYVHYHGQGVSGK